MLILTCSFLFAGYVQIGTESMFHSVCEKISQSKVPAHGYKTSFQPDSKNSSKIREIWYTGIGSRSSNSILLPADES
jgi:hypothetical protein